MDRSVQSDPVAAGPGLSQKEIIQASDQYELHQRIKQLLKQSSDAKEKGQWKKARDLLFAAWKIAKNNIATNTDA